MVSPIVEDIYPRVPISLNADQVLDWLTGKGTKYQRRGTSALREMAKEIGKAHDLFKEIPEAKTLSEIEGYGKEIDSLQIEAPQFDLEADFRQKQRDIAKDIFKEVGASPTSLNRIADVLEDNNYNLNVLRQHAFRDAQGNERLGIWRVGTGQFITNFKTGRVVSEVQEVQPQFDISELEALK